VFATVGVVPPLYVMLAGRGEGGGRDWCLAMMAIFFLRVERRVRIIETTRLCEIMNYKKKIYPEMGVRIDKIGKYLSVQPVDHQD
jgi:hypothetical protein